MIDRRLPDRWRGALLGTALGDAAGRPFEGRAQVTTAQVRSWLSSGDALTWTDDTAMTVALARSLIARAGEVDHQHLGGAFARSYEAEPWRGYGSGPPQVFAAAATGTPFVDAAAALFDGAGSLGNGAAMRAVPAAIAGGHRPERVAEVAREQARVTHAHPLAQDGAALVALVVGGLASRPDDPPTEVCARMVARLDDSPLRAAARQAVEEGAGMSPAGVAANLGNGVAAAEAVPAALAAFLGCPDQPREVLVRAVAIGGDTDTIAAMAGALTGAHVGADDLPGELLARLEAREDLVDLADTLAHVTSD